MSSFHWCGLVLLIGSFTAAYAGTVDTVPCVAGLSLSDPSVVGGGGVTGTVILTAPAPADGVAIVLHSTSPNAAVSNSIGIQPAETSATFAVATRATLEDVNVTITASVGRECAGAATLRVQAPVLAGLALSRSIACGGANLTGTAVLSGPAPEGGVIVSLHSSVPGVLLPQNVLIPAGEKSAVFPMGIDPSVANATVMIAASDERVIRTAPLRVQSML